MYHDLKGPVLSGFPGGGADVYKLEPVLFARHLEALHTHFPEGPVCYDGSQGLPARAPFCLTFDDGGVSALEIARQLAEHGWHAHFFITTGRIASPGFLNESGVRALQAQGHILGSHSENHPRIMSALTPNALMQEWQASVARLEDLTGRPTHTASVPGGYCSERVIEAAARAGIRVLFTSEPSRRVARFGPVSVVGRYAVMGGTPPEVAVGLAGASRWWQWRQWVRWQALKSVKVILGTAYPAVRQQLLSRKNRISHEHP